MDTEKKISPFDNRIIKVIDRLISDGAVKSRHDFCRKIDVQQSLLYRIEKGERGFSLNNIITICKLFNVNPNYIFGFEKSMFRLTPQTLKNSNANSNNEKKLRLKD